jgi:hypothetical protein
MSKVTWFLKISRYAHLGSYLKACKSTYKRDTCTPTLTAALVTITRLWNQLRYPTTNECIKKKVADIHSGVLFSHKEE